MQNVDSCSPGRRSAIELSVCAADCADALGSGDVAVLATPRVLALAEQAAVRALGDCLPEDKTSVGSWAELEHLHPSNIGETVTAEAVLMGVHGRRLEFSITVRSGDVDIAHCRHRRIIVNRSRFDKDAPRPQLSPGSEGSATAS
ncbi:MAG: thioesterase family protein [Egibacteraceae bacterium]